jgi:hypothetical protein
MNTITVFRCYKKNSMFILLIVIINTGFSIRIGSISNTTYIASTIDQTFFNMTCSQCICEALIAFAVGWNCMITNNTCQLIKNYSSTDFGLIAGVNTTFSFQQLPPIPLTTTNVITTVTTIETTIQTTTIGMYFKVISIALI